MNFADNLGVYADDLHQILSHNMPHRSTLEFVRNFWIVSYEFRMLNFFACPNPYGFFLFIVYDTRIFSPGKMRILP